MRFPHVKLIAAIGNFGQIGHGGELAWYDKRDLEHFKACTMGGLCVVGKVTAHKLPRLEGRDVYVWQRSNDPVAFARANAHRDIWIIGGAAIYRLWLPYVSMSVITHIDYSTQVDTYMPYLWRMPSPKPKKV